MLAYYCTTSQRCGIPCQAKIHLLWELLTFLNPLNPTTKPVTSKSDSVLAIEHFQLTLTCDDILAFAYPCKVRRHLRKRIRNYTLLWEASLPPCASPPPAPRPPNRWVRICRHPWRWWQRKKQDLNARRGYLTLWMRMIRGGIILYPDSEWNVLYLLYCTTYVNCTSGGLSVSTRREAIHLFTSHSLNIRILSNILFWIREVNCITDSSSDTHKVVLYRWLRGMSSQLPQYCLWRSTTFLHS